MIPRWLAAAALAVILPGAASAAPASPDGWEGVPRYDHVFVIVEENKTFEHVIGSPAAPEINALAARYGQATDFYGEAHPSEPNYVAIVGGDTFGIHDDEPWYCKPGSTRPDCGGAASPGYVDHTVHARHLGDQLAAAGLDWKGYYEDIPAPGSLAVISAGPVALYASKHAGFVNFADVQSDPRRAGRLVGFDQLRRDLASGRLPAFALVIPNQCNEMHGRPGPGVPPGCDSQDKPGLIRRGDAEAGRLVRLI